MIRVPDYLDPDAKTFWRRHAPALIKAGLLTERDVESFALLCRTWSTMKSVDTTLDPKGIMKFVGLSKQYQTLARQFSLLPVHRKRDKIDTEPVKEDEFNL